MGTPVKPALTLAIIAAVLTALVALVASFTRERIASNDVIADKFRTAGFADVDVHGEGSTRYAEGVWNKEDLKPTYPAQVSDVSEVVT